MSIKENYKRIREAHPAVRIVAVTKYVGPDKIIEAYNAGIRDFGENRAQDAEEKKRQLPDEINNNATWHFLGHLQANKVKKVVGSYEYIHSVDSLKLARAISQTAKAQNIVQKILIQVNITEESTKHGFNTDEIHGHFGEIIGLDSVQVTGFMTMAPFTQEQTVQRQTFKGLRELKNHLEKKYKINIPELSMGMSNDYEIACQEGATIIRIGHTIFSE